MSAHTPGPWSWWTSNSYRRLTAEGRQDGGVLHASESDWPTVVVSEADACLISAAPDLLEALQGVLRVADRKTDEFDAARAAIAKASGAA